mmetsp:Transcript_31479/g.57007  ORF Transcript_31479/g.57007 Transcript_31479/m.57007 type:complete len:124 (+) Transcript_31479:94-465(+)
MTIPTTNEKTPVTLEAAENPTPPQHEMTVEGISIEDPPAEQKDNWLILIGLALFVVGYTFVQIFAITWNFANLFAGVVAVVICLVFGCFSRRILQRYLLLATSVSAAYCGVLAGLLFFFRIRI